MEIKIQADDLVDLYNQLTTIRFERDRLRHENVELKSHAECVEESLDRVQTLLANEEKNNSILRNQIKETRPPFPTLNRKIQILPDGRQLWTYTEE